MPERFYLADVIGSGTLADPWRPAVDTIVAGVVWRTLAELRAVDASGGRIAVWCPDVSDANHATLAADVRVTVVPFENAQGDALSIATATIGDVPAAKRAAIATRLDVAHVPTDDLALADPLRKVLARVVRRSILRRILGADDFSEGLDTLVSAVAGPRRNTVAAILAAKGFDTSVIIGSDTIRQALRKLMAQALPLLANRWE
jgi:hypothetical protein